MEASLELELIYLFYISLTKRQFKTKSSFTYSLILMQNKNNSMEEKKEDKRNGELFSLYLSEQIYIKTSNNFGLQFTVRFGG